MYNGVMRHDINTQPKMFRRLAIFAQICTFLAVMGSCSPKTLYTPNSQKYDTIYNFVHDTIHTNTIEDIRRVDYRYIDTSLNADVHVLLSHKTIVDTTIFSAAGGTTEKHIDSCLTPSSTQPQAKVDKSSKYLTFTLIFFFLFIAIIRFVKCRFLVNK